METLHDLPPPVETGMYMCKLDLKSAYHSVAAHPHDHPYPCFRHPESGEVWRYTCLPFGLSDAPRAFSKVLAPVAAYLRKPGIRILTYLDDWWRAAIQRAHLKESCMGAVVLLERLGFTVNRQKSVLEPVQMLSFLGMELDTVKMSVTWPEQKASKVQHECWRLLRWSQITEPELHCLLGKMEASRFAVVAAPPPSHPRPPIPVAGLDSCTSAGAYTQLLGRGRPEVVGKCFAARLHCPSSSVPCHGNDHDRCLYSRMGCRLPPPRDGRSLAARGACTSYQLAGDVRRIPGPEDICPTPVPDLNLSGGRQWHDRCIHQQEGQDPVQGTLSASPGDMALGVVTGYSPDSCSSLYLCHATIVLLAPLDEHTRAVMFVQGLDPSVRSDALREHPTSLSEAIRAARMSKLSSCSGEVRATVPPPEALCAVSGRQTKAIWTEEHRRLMQEGRCFRCHRRGHLARHCRQQQHPKDGRQ